MCSTVKKCYSRLSLPLRNTLVYVTERYELTFTMIARIFQTRQHWTLHKIICCCCTTVSYVSRIKPKRTTLVVDTTIAIRYTLLKTTSICAAIQFGRIRTLLSISYKTPRISLISMLTIVPLTYPSWNSNSFAMEYGVNSTTL